MAGAELEATKRRVGDAVLRATFDVQVAYYTLLAAQQVEGMRRSALDAGDAAAALAEAQHSAGNISDLDLVNQRTLYEQLRTDVVRSVADVVVAREALTRLLGLWGTNTAFRAPSRLPDPPASDAALGTDLAEHPDRLEALAIGRRLDLASARAQVEALSRTAAMARTLRFIGSPGVGVTFERSPEGYSAVTPRASLELPIFDQHQAAVARLEALLRQAQAREAALGVDIRSEVRVACKRVLAMRDVVDRYVKVVVPLREQVVSLSQQQYGAMLLGAPQLLLAKQNELNAHRELIEALRDYWIARADSRASHRYRFPGRLVRPQHARRHAMNARRTFHLARLGRAVGRDLPPEHPVGRAPSGRGPGAPARSQRRGPDAPAPAAGPSGPYTPVVTPNGSTMPWTMKDGAKEFRIVAEPVKREFAPGMVVDCWGYNGQAPGPTIEVVEGDRVRLYLTNNLPERTSMHWHGALLPNGMDGVAGLVQRHIEPGETYVYEFTLRQHGTLMYHPHSDEMVQMALGMMGFFVVHPRGGHTSTESIATLPSCFTSGRRAGHLAPQPDGDDRLQPLHVQRPRLAGHRAARREEGRSRARAPREPEHGQPPDPPARPPVRGHRHGRRHPSAERPLSRGDGRRARRRDAGHRVRRGRPGDWAFHCHKSHHTMNAMSHDLPNMIGVEPGRRGRRRSAACCRARWRWVARAWAT